MKSNTENTNGRFRAGKRWQIAEGYVMLMTIKICNQVIGFSCLVYKSYRKCS